MTQASGALGTRIRTGDNPFAVDGTDDLLHVPPADQPGWSETMYFHVWSVEHGVGVFVHVGRWPDDLDLWWVQTIAMLPDGRLLVDRSWGRALDNRGPATGNLRIMCVEPLRRWRLQFDGAGEATDLLAMSTRPVGAGPAQPFAFDVELTAAAPVWDMGRALGAPEPKIDELSWAAFHHTQGFHADGELRVAGERTSLRGVAHRDHSSGLRDVSRLGGLNFFVVVFPESGRVANGLVNWRSDGTVDHRVFTVFEQGTCETGSDVRVTGLESFQTHQPHQMSITMARETGPSRMRAEWLHGYTMTFLSPNENIIGVDLASQPDPLIIAQSTVRVVGPDGDVGYGVIERDYRPSMLPSSDER